MFYCAKICKTIYYFYIAAVKLSISTLHNQFIRPFNYKSWSLSAKWESKFIFNRGYKRTERPSAIYLTGSWAYRNIVLGAYATFKLKRDIYEESFFRNPAIDRYTWSGIDGGESRIALSFTYKLSVGRKGDGRNPQSTLGADKED